MFRSFAFTIAGSIVMLGAGVGTLAWMGHSRAALLLGASQGLCFLLVAFVADHMRRSLAKEAAWEIALSWVLYAAFVVGVVVLTDLGYARGANILMVVMAALYLVSTALIRFVPDPPPDRRGSGDG